MATCSRHMSIVIVYSYLYAYTCGMHRSVLCTLCGVIRNLVLSQPLGFVSMLIPSPPYAP